MHSTASCVTIYICHSCDCDNSLAIASVYIRRLVAAESARTHDAHAPNHHQPLAMPIPLPPLKACVTYASTLSHSPSRSSIWAQPVPACAWLLLVVKKCILVVDIISIEHIRVRKQGGRFFLTRTKSYTRYKKSIFKYNFINNLCINKSVK